MNDITLRKNENGFYYLLEKPHHGLSFLSKNGWIEDYKCNTPEIINNTYFNSKRHAIQIFRNLFKDEKFEDYTVEPF